MWQITKAGFILSTVIGLVVWIGRPDLFDKQILEPFRQAQAREMQQKMDAAKNAEFDKWMQTLDLPTNCNTSALKQVECKNRTDLHIRAFENMWHRKTATGYQP